MEGYAEETKTLLAADILISLIDFLGDVVLLHRCWLVWGKNFFVVLLPALTAIGGFGMSILLCYWRWSVNLLTVCGMTGLGILNNIDPTAPQAPPEVKPLGTAAFSLPLATNFLVTIFTVIRLLMLASKARKVGSDSGLNTTTYVNKAAAIVIESGLLYLVAQLVFVVLFAIGHPAQGIAAVVAVQVYVSLKVTILSYGNSTSDLPWPPSNAGNCANAYLLPRGSGSCHGRIRALN